MVAGMGSQVLARMHRARGQMMSAQTMQAPIMMNATPGMILVWNTAGEGWSSVCVAFIAVLIAT